MSRRAFFLLAIVVLAFTVGAAAHAAASADMAAKMMSTGAAEPGAPPCDGCGGDADDGKAPTLCPYVCVASLMAAILPGDAALHALRSLSHPPPATGGRSDRSRSPEPYPPRLA